MTISGFLPQRWRSSPEIARHAEAVAGILHTSPLAPCDSGPGVISLLGTSAVLPYLVAIKSLRHRIDRARIVIIDDGTLTGEDRAILAHHCGDPEIRPHQAVARGAFPPGGAWALLLTMLDRRAGQYWISLDPHTVTLGALDGVEAAIASNRSFTLQAGPVAAGGPARRVERRLAVLCGTRGWRYRPGCSALTGFAAGGTGRSLAAAFLNELAALGDDSAASADFAGNVLLANEAEPVLLPQKSYHVFRAKQWDAGAALVHFPASHRYQGDAYIEASRAAIAVLGG